MIFDQKKRELANKLLSNRIAKFLGDVSYSVYLIHFMILTPVVYFFLQSEWWTALPDAARFLTAFFATVVPTYLLGYILFRTVELPGISAGRRVIRSVRSARTGPLTGP
jgi:peptidoglycan/LPS O-acetylase OafA/YrhL